MRTEQDVLNDFEDLGYSINIKDECFLELINTNKGFGGIKDE